LLSKSLLFKQQVIHPALSLLAPGDGLGVVACAHINVGSARSTNRPARVLIEHQLAQTVPWLVNTAGTVRDFVDQYLASPATVRTLWEEIKTSSGITNDISKAMDIALTHEYVLLERPSGALISKLIESCLISNYPFGVMKSNGASDYPDLFIVSDEHQLLPLHGRKRKGYGAALKGGRPVRIPDGIEIKTARVGAGIDCHYPHTGLHYVLQYDNNSRPIQVTDIKIGYVVEETYHISKQNTEATTAKASFSPGVIASDAFISILNSSL
jgi:hypothetical protein